MNKYHAKHKDSLGSNCVASRKKGLVNCVDCYRKEEKLSYHELGIILGNSRSSAKSICETFAPSVKHIRMLASHENLSIPEFYLRYSPLGKDAA